MSQLKPSYEQKVRDALTASAFTLQDFNIEFPESGKIQFIITFVHYDNYSFTVKDANYDSESMSVIVRPSNYKKQAEWELKGFDDALKQIPLWCNNIRDDLYSMAPNRDPLEALRTEFEKQIDTLIENPEDNFSSAELDAVNQKFDSLYKEFSSLKDEYEISKQQLQKIKQQFEEFKKSAESYPKGVWGKITNNKLVDIVGEVFKSKEGRQFILGELKKLISN